jgi:hypothetical protein
LQPPQAPGVQAEVRAAGAHALGRFAVQCRQRGRFPVVLAPRDLGADPFAGSAPSMNTTLPSGQVMQHEHLLRRQPVGSQPAVHALAQLLRIADQ